MNATVFLGLGTNMGERERNLNDARNLISGSIGKIISKSPIYETEPWGFECNDLFLNMVIKVLTELSPVELLRKVRDIERNLGREQLKKRYSSRIIDIDILVYGDRIIKRKNLEIPHPLIPERRFVLVPLCDIEPGGMHPVLKKTFSELLIECRDTKQVERI